MKNDIGGGGPAGPRPPPWPPPPPAGAAAPPPPRCPPPPPPCAKVTVVASADSASAAGIRVVLLIEHLLCFTCEKRVEPFALPGQRLAQACASPFASSATAPPRS